MAGGPSHLETFDSKPKLAEMHGKPMPESMTKGQQSPSSREQKLKCFGPQHPFQQFGKIRHEICALFPAHRLGRRRHLPHPLDDHRRDQPRSGPHVHEHRLADRRPAQHGLVGHLRPGERGRRPARLRGADLAGQGGQNQPIAARQWSAGFLPSRIRACSCAARAIRCCISSNPAGVTREQQGADVGAINALNRQYDALVDDPEIATRIAQYEMAFQMQASVPELMDIRERTAADA